MPQLNTEKTNNRQEEPWSVVIHEAPPGTHTEVDDDSRILNIMMKDADESGRYFSYISNKLGVRPHGYK